MEVDRFCINCKHFRPAGTGPRDGRCNLALQVNYVTGEKSYGSCESERMPLGKCKTLAILYEPKDAN